MTSLPFWLHVGCPLWGTPRHFAVWCFSCCQPAGPDKAGVAVGDLQPSPVQGSLQAPRTICCSWQVQSARLNAESGSALPSLKHHRKWRSCQPLTGRRLGPEPSVHTSFLLLPLLMPSKFPQACRMNRAWPHRKSWCWEGNVTRSLELSVFKKRHGCRRKLRRRGRTAWPPTLLEQRYVSPYVQAAQGLRGTVLGREATSSSKKLIIVVQIKTVV